MDKNTILAVVLSVVIITVFFGIQAVFFPSNLGPSKPKKQETTEKTDSSGQESRVSTPGRSTIEPVADEGERATEKKVTAKTGTFQIQFSTRGAKVTSLLLNSYTELGGSPVEMVISGESGLYPYILFLDGYDTGKDVYAYSPSVMSNEWEFTKRYVFQKGDKSVPFTVKKKFVFKPNDYMMELRVELVTDQKEELPIERYTVNFGPQIGPQYDKLDGRNDFRHLIYYADGKRKDYSGKVKLTRKEIEERAVWAGIEGKYFIVIGISYISDLSEFRIGFDTTRIDGLEDNNSLYFDRLVKGNFKVDDGYKFYIGPKKRDILLRYNDRNQNEFQESGMHLENAVPSDFWGWLSNILKWLLEMFYKLIPNWGVAIILLTILIKIVFFPLTRKSFDSTHKMQTLGPKIEELKKKYKSNPQKMNQEMAALYKKEGVNPLGGCLPLLLQMPIFFALYSLFSNYFELRGAAFISPWIADLSSPEKVFSLPFSIPFLGAEFRFLPFFMLATTFIQQKISSPPGQAGNKQTKMLMYAMPLFFFFIMYNMPSGLLIYWTMQNLVTFITQFYINHLKEKKEKETGD